MRSTCCALRVGTLVTPIEIRSEFLNQKTLSKWRKAMSKLMLSFTATFCATMCAILLYVERENLSTSTEENVILSILFAVIAILSFSIFYKECNDWFHLNEE